MPHFRTNTAATIILLLPLLKRLPILTAPSAKGFGSIFWEGLGSIALLCQEGPWRSRDHPLGLPGRKTQPGQMHQANRVGGIARACPTSKEDSGRVAHVVGPGRTARNAGGLPHAFHVGLGPDLGKEGRFHEFCGIQTPKGESPAANSF